MHVCATSCIFTMEVLNGIRQNSSPSTNLLSPAQASGDCGPSIATLTDNDNDDIPASYNGTFKDCTEVNALIARIKNGTVTVTDSDDNNPNSGSPHGLKICALIFTQWKIASLKINS